MINISERERIKDIKSDIDKNYRASQIRSHDSSVNSDKFIDRIIFLQKTAGNKSVEKMISSGTLNAKFKGAEQLIQMHETQKLSPISKSYDPAIMRTPIFSSTIEICRRVLRSREFQVSQGGLVIVANARWEASARWEGASSPECGRDVYQMTLNKKGILLDSEYGSCAFEMGRPFSRTWANLPDGDYYLDIWTNNTNPNCCLRGDIVVSQQSGITGETCTRPPPGPLEVLHDALAIAGLIPALGAVPDAVDATIYLIQGEWVQAGLSAVAIVPIFGDAASVARIGRRTVVRITGRGIERVGRDGIATGLREARASRRAAVESVEEAQRRGRGRPHGGEGAGIRPRVPGLPGCRAGSLFCPIGFLQEEFADIFAARRSSNFASYVREFPEIDLNMGRSLRRNQTILTGNEMYAQYLREVSPSQWSEPFREAMSRMQRGGVDYRELIVGGQRHRWPLDDIGSPWVIHHDPPLGWVLSESNQWWHPMPYRIHDSAHNWWRRLENRIKSRIPRERRMDYLEGEIDIREL